MQTMNKDIKIFTDMIEESAIEQIEKISSIDAFKNAKIRIMPDVHAGKGCVCGFTADLGDKVVPNLIGVDIGCAVLVSKLDVADIDFKKLDKVIRRQIPSGTNVNGRDVVGDRRDYAANDCDPKNCWASFTSKEHEHFDKSLMSLGGGNHFCEIDKDKDGCLYLVIHCGSRNFGKKVCDYWQNVAVERAKERAGIREASDFKEQVEEVKRRCIEQGHPELISEEIAKLKAENDEKLKAVEDLDLAWLENEDRDRYIHDMKIAQRWAALNRKMIAERICKAMGWTPIETFDTVHNYLGDDNIIRKSAISARAGEKVLIPMNMRDGSIIGIGKGNEDWNFSAPHGAGRTMSRSKAKDSISMQEYIKSMDGIFTTSVSEETVDEAPMAYKPADKIIEQMSDTVEVIEVLKPVYNFKAPETRSFKKKDK